MGTNGDYWGLNFVGTTGKTIDVIPQVPKSSQATDSIFILLPTILGTNGDCWGLMGTKFHGDYR